MNDYALKYPNIQAAMLAHVRSHPSPTRRPRSIVWQGREIWTSYELSVPRNGTFTIHFRSRPQGPQGVDVKAEQGTILLADGERTTVLRTWNDDRYTDRVTYPYTSDASVLKVWNVYSRTLPDGSVFDDKWTGNAGFWVESDGDLKIFHCSPGWGESADFDQLVFDIRVERSVDDARQLL